MNARPDKMGFVRQWIEKAEHDLTAAKHTLTIKGDDCPFDTVCFHAQQCAEKYLKALLIFHEVDFPKTHDLMVLKNLIPVLPHGMEGIALQTLNRYSVEARYPGNWEPMGRTEAEIAIGIAKEVKDAVRSAVPL